MDLSTISNLKIEKPCPSCGNDSAYISKTNIFCNLETCGFEHSYCCPICQDPPSQSALDANQSSVFHCKGCQNSISTKKIKSLIDNDLQIDYDVRCDFCNSPTLHRRQMNIGNRCFFFPKCSGQADLFSEKKQSFTFLDFGTTGLEVGRDSIIEIGALKLGEDGDEHIYQTFVKPLSNLPPMITQITGITNDMVKEAPSLSTSLKELISFIGTSKIVAHNANFDISWLLTTSIRHEIPLQNNSVICTLEWAKQANESKCSLGALAKKYHISHSNAHRALADAVTTKELFFILSNMKHIDKPDIPLSNYRDTCLKIVEKYNTHVQL